MTLLTLVADAPSAAQGDAPEGKRILSPSDHARVRAAYRDRMPLNSLPAYPSAHDASVESTLDAVLRDALAHPGSLLRAQLAFDVQRRNGVDSERALDLAVAIEYFHTASLLFDDLPSMDDGTERRGRPCPHKVWGEAATQLAGLALITRAYELLWQSFAGLSSARSRRGAELVGACLGVRGILDGQSRDLHPPESWSAREVQRVAEGKTVTLIRLSLVLPALVAGATDEELAELEGLAQAWGFAYQVLDDFKDHLLTADESGKTPQRDRKLRRPNLPSVLGGDAALVHLRGLLDDAYGRVRVLASTAAGGTSHRATDRWSRLASVHRILETDYTDVAGRLELAACA